jgi:hypothetical protein
LITGDQRFRVGHQLGRVEIPAFNELAQHYPLTHCPRSETAMIQNRLLILALGFNLFERFARLNSKLWRQGRVAPHEPASSPPPQNFVAYATKVRWTRFMALRRHWQIAVAFHELVRQLDRPF